MMRLESRQVTQLSDGHFMVHGVSDAAITVMWNRMSRPQKEEFEIAYGVESAFDKFREEIRHASHKVACYCGCDLTCIIWSDWADIGNVGRIRTVGCVCSDFAYRHPMNFCKHSKEVRDIFLRGEPKGKNGAKEIYVMITETFKSSRKWAVKFCGCEEAYLAKCNGHDFVVYRFVQREVEE